MKKIDVADHFCSLLDVIHCDQKLFLVFEFLSQDLKKFMDNYNGVGLNPDLVKVCIFSLLNTCRVL